MAVVAPSPARRGSLVDRARCASMIAAALSLAACTVESEDGDREDVGRAASDIVICPGNSSVLGIDVSYYQGNIDWNAVRDFGVKFAIARKSDGTFMDAKFQQNWDGIKAAGLICGVYQYFEPDGDPVVQANIVIDAVGKLGAGDLPAMIDVEAAGNVTTGQYADRIQTWIDLVEAGTGKPP